MNQFGRSMKYAWVMAWTASGCLSGSAWAGQGIAVPSDTPDAPDAPAMVDQASEEAQPSGQIQAVADVVVVQREPAVGWLELSEPLREDPAPYAWMTDDEAGPSLDQVLMQLRTVADDQAYLGLVIYLDQPGLTLTQVTAIAQQIEAIRATGKTVMTFAQAYDTLDYVLASACDLILLQHHGQVQLMGLSVEEMYLKGLLDKIGATADLLQTGQFKGANEQMTRTGPSAAWSANIDALLDDLYQGMVSRIARGRSLSTQDVQTLIRKTWTMTTRDYLKHRVVDRLCGRDLIEVTEVTFGDDFVWDDTMGQSAVHRGASSPLALFQMMFQSTAVQTRRPTIAVVHASGPITSGDSSTDAGLFGSSSIGSRTMLEVFDEIDNDPNIQGAVIRLDSPGGSALASEMIWQAARETAQHKPVYLSVGSMAASGGYYIASAADQVYVAPDSIVGSIGVVSGKIVLGGTYEKLGIDVHRRSRGPLADMFNSIEPFTAEQRQVVQQSMDHIYNLFLDRVRAGRGTRLNDLAQVDEGMLFTGRQAVTLGMADHLGHVDDAIGDLAQSLDLQEDQYDLLHLPEPMSFQEYLGQMFGVSSSQIDLQAGAGLLAIRSVVGPHAWRSLGRTVTGLLLLREESVLALMPRVIVIK